MKIGFEEKDILNPTVIKLISLVEKYYGCSLEYRSLTRLLTDNPELALLENSLQEGQLVNAGDLTFLPIFQNKTLAGAAQFSITKTLTEQQLSLLSQTVRVILESRLENIDRIDFLEKFESSAQEGLGQKQKANSNVIQLKRFQPNPYPLPERNTKIASELNFSFMIEGPALQTEELFKMAFEIHTRSQRYAFLPIEDLSPATFESPKTINDLGHMTIYIDSIAQLSAQRQTQLLNYLNSERDKESPQFIVATTTPLADLKKSQLMNQDLLSRLSVGYLFMAQPFAAYKRENLLDFFYDNLTGRTSV